MCVGVLCVERAAVVGDVVAVEPIDILRLNYVGGFPVVGAVFYCVGKGARVGVQVVETHFDLLLCFEANDGWVELKTGLINQNSMNVTIVGFCFIQECWSIFLQNCFFCILFSSFAFLRVGRIQKLWLLFYVLPKKCRGRKEISCYE